MCLVESLEFQNTAKCPELAENFLETLKICPKGNQNLPGSNPESLPKVFEQFLK